MIERRYFVLAVLLMATGCACSLAYAQDEAGSPDGGPTFSNHNEGMWDIDVQYPHFDAAGAVPTKVNADMAASAEGEFSSFLGKAESEVPKLREIGSPGMYILLVKPTVTTDLPELCSGYVQRMVATGGANANATYSVFNFVADGDGVRQLKLADLFSDNTDCIAEASAAALAEIEAWDRQPSYVADGSWTELTPEQAQRFAVTPIGLLFLFNKYELGPGVEGPRTVLVPYESLNGLDTRDYLQLVLEPKSQD
jgi:hypothetical protein